MTEHPKSLSGGPYIGRSIPRFEDLRLVRGAGRYTDDISVPGQTYAYFLRAPHAHARIKRIDTAAARAMKGVLAVLTGADYLADGLQGALQRPNPAGAIDIKLRAFAPEKRPVLEERQLPIATDRVRYPGEIVAMVVAESLLAARDAAEGIEVAYEVLPSATDVRDAIGGEPIWQSAVDNVALDQDFGDRDAVANAFASAELVVEHTFRNQRIVNAQMEPRSGVASYDPAGESYTLMSGNQGVHVPRAVVSECFGVPEAKLRFICPDVGGGFGLRNNLYPEQAAIIWAAKRVGRPVKWTNDRSESFLTDYQGRDMLTTARLALTRDGRITAYHVDHVGGVGGQTVTYVPLSNAYRVATTVYDIPLMHMRCRGIMTNTVPTAPFRGAGRPEATLVLERLLDLAATRLGMDRVAFRRKNLIRRDKLPYRTASGLTYDSGDFTGNLKRVLEQADWKGFSARRRESKKRGKLRGIGIANYVETPVGIPHERAEVTVTPDKIELAVGTQSTGQGHETTFAQVMADQLGVRPEDITFIGGDTALVASGSGTHSDRSMRLAGMLMVQASGDVVKQARAVAAKLLQVSEADIAFTDGLFVTPNSNHRLSMFDLAREIKENPALSAGQPLHAKATFTGRIPAYPTGCAICEVEIDPDTGAIEVARYTSIDDAGQAINPMILHGQVHGGIAQGVGQALLEDVIYAKGSGQVLTGSFMDYGIPRAHHLPMFDVALTEDPTKGNPLRVKGGGEAGITPALAVVMNAVMDALSVYGIEHIDMPATPHRIWSAIEAAKKTSGRK
jgi:aerobic carbon-monoxide dehydrogenase large subunit